MPLAPKPPSPPPRRRTPLSPSPRKPHKRPFKVAENAAKRLLNSLAIGFVNNALSLEGLRPSSERNPWSPLHLIRSQKASPTTTVAAGKVFSHTLSSSVHHLSRPPQGASGGWSLKGQSHKGILVVGKAVVRGGGGIKAEWVCRLMLVAGRGVCAIKGE